MNNMRKDIEKIIYECSAAKYFLVKENSSLHKDLIEAVTKIVNILEKEKCQI